MANTWTVEAILTWISMHINYFTLEFFSSSAGGNCWDKTDRAVLFAVLLRLNLTAIRIPFSIAFGLVTSAKRKALARLQTIWSWRTLWKSQRTFKEACQVWVWGRRPLWSMTFVIWSQACGLQLAFRRPLARSTGSYSESVILLVIGHAVLARCFNLDSRMNELRLHIASEPPWATWHNFISQGRILEMCPGKLAHGLLYLPFLASSLRHSTPMKFHENLDRCHSNNSPKFLAPIRELAALEPGVRWWLLFLAKNSGQTLCWDMLGCQVCQVRAKW